MKAAKVSVHSHQPSPQLQKLDQKLKQAAQMYEKQFLRQMVQAMRNSVSHSALTQPNFAENIYRDQLDDKYVDSWVERGGNGFTEMVYEELVNKYYPQLAKSAPPPGIRPVDISDRYQGIRKAKTEASTRSQTFQIDLKAQNEGEKSFLRLPWRSEVKASYLLGDGQNVVELSHPNGLTSRMAFRGQFDPKLLNKTLSEGEVFAELNAPAQSVTWQILAGDSRKASSDPEKTRID